MNDENAEHETLVALINAARAPYDCAVRWKLSRAEVLALVRGLLAGRPGGLTPAELRELAGRAGVPASVLVRVGRGGPAAAPLVGKATTWSGRTRLAGGHGA
jgi:hypothetical protein